MALILLNPGLRPLGQFDFKDDDSENVTGGEIAKIVTLSSADSATEAYAADVGDNRDLVQFQLDSFSDGRLCGLVDEGTSAEDDKNCPGYGTLFGKNLSMQTSGVIGPPTIYGSGKATIWHQAGLYGVTEEAFLSSAQVDAAVSGGINTSLFGTATGSSSAGKLTTASSGNEAMWWLGRETETSLVATTKTAAGATIATEYHMVYFPGPTK